MISLIEFVISKKALFNDIKKYIHDIIKSIYDITN